MNRVSVIKTRIDNFHGYPAVKEISTDSRGINYNEGISIAINSHLMVFLGTSANGDKGYSLSEAEANIEKFAHAIDFNAIQASA